MCIRDRLEFGHGLLRWKLEFCRILRLPREARRRAAKRFRGSFCDWYYEFFEEYLHRAAEAAWRKWLWSLLAKMRRAQLGIHFGDSSDFNKRRGGGGEQMERLHLSQLLLQI